VADAAAIFFVLRFNLFLLNLLQSIQMVGVSNYIQFAKTSASLGAGVVFTPPLILIILKINNLHSYYTSRIACG
jgi:Sec-independent protein secretion pathway component TatC